ncbi:copper homeostasis protein CutC [Hymenobacter sp. NBH84]|uniref:copper homeostasis protein CutC n=1 Tax=Hymenobacter sp. NBH84 TaxID=2596915 RepID=UPI001CA53488|nr:copper homeostasis protein CutC [Hymenobacter sp. NBH84]
MSYTLEICANSVQSAQAAQAGGAGRIELCQNLEQGGITPSYGLIRRVRALLSIQVFVLIRPRPGNFVYDNEEFALMQTDVLACRELGCDGVVLGILNEAGRVDMARCRTLIALAGSMQVTFHRAFDVCQDQAQALEEVIQLGCTRILTSGGATSAEAGQQQLAALVAQAAGRISIQPGAGINAENLLPVAAATGATEFHTSAKKLISLPSQPNQFDVTHWQTDAGLVRELVELLAEGSD